MTIDYIKFRIYSKVSQTITIRGGLVSTPFMDVFARFLIHLEYSFDYIASLSQFLFSREAFRDTMGNGYMLLWLKTLIEDQGMDDQVSQVSSMFSFRRGFWYVCPASLKLLTYRRPETV